MSFTKEEGAITAYTWRLGSTHRFGKVVKPANAARDAKASPPCSAFDQLLGYVNYKTYPFPLVPDLSQKAQVNHSIIDIPTEKKNASTKRKKEKNMWKTE